MLRRAADDAAAEFERLRGRWFERLLGPERDELPASAHLRWLRRLSPLESTYTRERSLEICLETVRALGFELDAIPNIRLDLEDRPQKSPRACVIAADAPEIVHLITRAQGGLSDYQAFLHEAGHALHYAGVGPGLSYTFRNISRDHALTEIYSYIVEAVTREPGWHALHFGLSDAEAEENAEATRFLEVLLYRRYAAKLRYELGFWGEFPAERGNSSRDYEPLLTEATGLRYDARAYLSDMDAGFYSADYLRAWIRSAQLQTYLRREIGEDWWRSARDGRDPARAVRRGHAALDRGHRAPARLRSARHRAARRRVDRRLSRRPPRVPHDPRMTPATSGKSFCLARGRCMSARTSSSSSMATSRMIAAM